MATTRRPVAAKKSGSAAPFDFTINGKTVRLQPADSIDLTFRQRRLIAAGDKDSVVILMIEQLCDPETMDVLDTFTTSEVKALGTAWTKHNQGVSVGESPAS